MKASAASLTALLAIALLAVLPADLLARSSDRNQPMDIDADDFDHSLNESQPTVFIGNVVIKQGTLDIRSVRAEVTVRNGEPTRAVLTGSPATLKQEMDDGSPFNARANRIDYDLTVDTVTLTGDVSVRQDGNTMNGPRLVYNMRTGRVQASSNASDNGRVKLRIMPKNGNAAPGKPEGN
ncbi:lipopolysaccharide transport periplasmic protein LptA [Marilutibacter alkalisoli]|uniref:Lipopolysaccharide export system protein LptA n=1 Tax=Marilutibacter alkalisoli TaxID=2591633 RepID=A0A514BQN9_9GAMM|nr:lipopolysaccharide transport periplasmic protein LptA [Lysobacter alkalisoli]QDH69339.1 lipopolysaccharide transport periplasmic protein LptA [Lysobacter alkalisoli]